WASVLSQLRTELSPRGALHTTGRAALKVMAQLGGLSLAQLTGVLLVEQLLGVQLGDVAQRLPVGLQPRRSVPPLTPIGHDSSPPAVSWLRPSLSISARR